ncbi:hypothetical protein LTR37_006122 [Vermiconidia calcicola]|uniref:Uncharacterized protein n=1 Tax=Vermiconidia calcicola TaxID=1690605 RepID=A0ACC3NHY9_9PEZI|nr:hypothetical protein LTR37_006122 [Vermiconidia calcicola]
MSTSADDLQAREPGKNKAVGTHAELIHGSPVYIDAKASKDAELPNAENKDDAEKLADSRDTSNPVSRTPSEHQDGGDDGQIIVSFTEHDRTSPFNWPRSKKLYVVFTGMAMVINSTLGSALPSGATGVVAEYFDVHQQELLVLPVSIYLIGYILGPLIFAPLSESYGRKIVMICTFVMFTIFVMATALSPNFASLIIFRLMAGIGASTPVSVIGGIYADIYNNQRARGVAITAFMAGTTWGPLLGPLISGFVSVGVSWRWVYWIELIIVGCTWPFLLFMPETYGPVILRQRAKKMREDTGNSKILAPTELEKQDLWQLVTVVLTRPIRMFLFEAIVFCSSLYLALEYGIFYIFFQAFNPIFAGTYGFNPGEVGMAFIPIGVGSVIAGGIYLWWDDCVFKAREKSTPPAWSQKEEFIRLPLACLAGPLLVSAKH